MAVGSLRLSDVCAPGAGDDHSRCQEGPARARCQCWCHDKSPVTLVSFGFGHSPAAGEADVGDATIVVDVRWHLRDPHLDPALRNLDGRDQQVREAVLRTPGAEQLVSGIISVICALRAGPRPGPVKVAIGCAGGRHRSVVIAAEVCERLIADGREISARVLHRDIGKPVLPRGGGNRA